MLIGISGKANVGKSTLARMLVYIKEHPDDTFTEYLRGRNIEEERHKITSFSHVMKLCLSMIFNERIELFDEQWFKQKVKLIPTMNVRTLLQKFGQAMRDIYPDFWVEATMNNLEAWIIDDVRFPNEANSILAKGGKLIRLESDKAKDMNDISETALDDFTFDTVITNNGTLEELYNKAKKLL